MTESFSSAESVFGAQTSSFMVKATGILATICPADKKILHGMKDAIMAPCAVRPT